MTPVVIAIGGQTLSIWTDMTLKRAKKQLTGELEVTIFTGGMPGGGPMVREAKAGAEITVYIMGHLAFTGTVDGRTGQGGKHGKGKGGKGKVPGRKSDKTTKQKNTAAGGGHFGTGATQADSSMYSVKISARGKTKRLIDSSHQHPTTNMLKPTTKEVVEKLVEPWKTQVEWKGEIIKLDKVRFRDGARVVDELFRVGTENAYFMYETRDGKLRVTDGVGTASGSGDPLILGQNILTFKAEQSEDKSKSKIKVKGQRSEKSKWGKDAVAKTFKTIETKAVRDFVPFTIPHFGDADEKTLERRARFEANMNATEAKKVTVEVFHVQSPSGNPWDIGDTHYVEIPIEGIYDTFEVTELTYNVDNEKTLKTSLVLSPPPSGGAGGAGGGFGLSMLNMAIGSARRSQAGMVLSAASYPDPWLPSQLSEMPLLTLVEEAAKLAASPPPPELPTRDPPLTLPHWFDQSGSDT